jgi:hypothetical protein
MGKYLSRNYFEHSSKLPCFHQHLQVRISHLTIRFFTDYKYRTSSDPRYEKAAKLEPIFSESFLDITLVLGLYTAMQWTRILLIFRVNSFVGPLLNIIQNMLREIVRFFIIYLLIVLVFTSAGRMLFVTLPEFKDDIETWKTLFSASLGSFDFTIFDHQRMVLSQDFGYFFLMIYLLITNIIILNFIIAILGNTYSRLKNISKALYLIEIVKVRNIFEYDKYYSSMISLFIPLNVVLLPFYPILAISKNKRLNQFLMHFSYLPVLMLGIIAFVGASLIMYPISYFALLFQNFVDIWEKGENGTSKWGEA